MTKSNVRDIDEDRHIEVYEWRKGAPRPGSVERPSENCIDILAIPSHGQVPQRGDVLHLHMPSDPDANLLGGVCFVVLERELLWGIRAPEDDGSAQRRWSKMWIHVRRLDDYEKQALA